MTRRSVACHHPGQGSNNGRRRSAARRGSLSALVLALFAVLFTSPRGATPERKPLGLEPSGCHAVLTDGTCERPPDGVLRLWVNAQGPIVTLLDASEVQPSEAIQVDNGTRLVLQVGTASVLEVDAGGRRRSLKLAPPKIPVWALEAAAMRARGDEKGARALAQLHLFEPSEHARAIAKSLVARTELALGNIGAAVALLRESSREAELAGRNSEAVDDRLALSFALARRSGRWAEASAEIERALPFVEAYPDGAARLPYYRALAASAMGNIRAAMHDLRLAMQRAERLGLARLAWNIRNEWALSLERAGQTEEALGELRALAESRDRNVTACDRSTVLFNVGFAILNRRRDGIRPCDPAAKIDDAAGFLHAASELCPNAPRNAMGHVLLGDVALSEGRIDDAAQELDRVDLHEASPALRRDALDLEARLAFARREPDVARSKYERLVTLARATGRIEDERRALEGLGLAYERLGLEDAALDVFARSEELLVSASVLVPLGEAGAYHATREIASRARIELLLRKGRIQEAFIAARTARSRLFLTSSANARASELPDDVRARWNTAVERYRMERKALDEAGERDWELASSALIAARKERERSLVRLRSSLDDAARSLPQTSTLPEEFSGPDEVGLLAMTGRSELIVFVHAAHGLRAVRTPIFDTSSRGEVAHAIRRAGGSDIAPGRRLRLVTSADLACVDVHADVLPEGMPLGLATQVTYGMDLGPAPDAPTRKPLTLVVADTHDDLPLARDEAALISAFRERQGQVVRLVGAHASSGAVRELLSQATFFHYAGHADEVDGESGLPLAGTGRLTIADVLALPQAPARVVLSACEAGRIRASGIAVGIGLAQAFLEKGALAVLAPSRPVRDDLALALAGALRTEPDIDFAQALRNVAKQHPDFDWAAYRIWGR